MGKGGSILLGFGVAWLAYGIGWTGWVLLRGWDIPLSELWSPVNFYTGKAPEAGSIPATKIWPSGKAS